MWSFYKILNYNDNPAFITDANKKSPSNVYVSLETNTVYVYRQKEVMNMDFDIEKLREYYNELLKTREQKVAEALANKDSKIRDRFEEEKARIEQKVVAEIIADAEAPYIHDIELCEKFLVPVEEPKDENTESVEG